MPELKSQYLQTHQRTICPGCRFWVLWYRDKKGKKAFSCEIGEIPYKDECRHLKGKRNREVTTVI